jgi:ATP-dependent DNA helicase RecQ
VAHSPENGVIRLVKHTSEHLVTPLVEDVQRLALRGTTAVLTPTNEAAQRVENGLRGRGVPVRLILSNEGFSLGDLLEIRHFTDGLAGGLAGDRGLVTDATWDAARQATEAAFAGSDKLPLARAVIGQFGQAYPRKLLAEWQAYLKEMRFEDFYYPEESTVLVSTMHKAKGKEFDHVFLLLENYPLTDDARKRAVYVALTRARHTLVIHTNGTAFDRFRVEGLETLQDAHPYTPADQICYRLTHEDVYLGGFRHPKVAAAVDGLQAGQPLPFGYDPDGRPFLRLPNGCTLRLSYQFESRLAVQRKAGYEITGALVHFIVYWRDAEADCEHKVVLPLVTMGKQYKTDN